MSTALTKNFGNYVPLSTATTAQNKTDINAMLNAFLALFQVEGPSVAATGAGDQPVYPEFSLVPIEVAAQIRAEVNAMIANINASP